MRPLVAALIFCLAGAGAASAAPIDPRGDPAQFQRDVVALNSKPLPDGVPLARAVGAAVSVDAARRKRCAPTKLTLGQLEPVTLDGMITAMIAKGEIENAWLISAKLDNCPPADPIRVLLFRLPDGATVQGLFAGQGESLAWPSLSREALRATVGKTVDRLRVADPGCKPDDMTPTGVRVSERSDDLGPNVYGIRLKGWWSEVWSFEPCGHKVAIPIAFHPDGRGGAQWDIAEDKIVYQR